MAQYPGGIIDRLKGARRTTVVEATEKAKKMGAPKAFNVIVLGIAAKHTGFEREGWLKVIETTAPPKTVEIDKKTLEIGYMLSV